jgi:hypothetical protein
MSTAPPPPATDDVLNTKDTLGKSEAADDNTADDNTARPIKKKKRIGVFFFGSFFGHGAPINTPSAAQSVGGTHARTHTHTHPRVGAMPPPPTNQQLEASILGIHREILRKRSNEYLTAGAGSQEPAAVRVVPFGKPEYGWNACCNMVQVSVGVGGQEPTGASFLVIIR